jgi:hypothetical protein
MEFVDRTMQPHLNNRSARANRPTKPKGRISMNSFAKRMPRPYLIILSLYLLNIGCGGGGYSSPVQPSPAPSPQPSPTPGVQSMQGPWVVWFHSDVSNEYIVLEANISQSGTQVFAGATSALVYQGTIIATVTPPTALGSKCDSGGIGSVTLDGTLSNQQATTETLDFTLTQTGTLGAAVITASASTDGSQISSGTYSIPAACGFSEDHGTIQGFHESVSFSAGDTYTGSFHGDSIIVRFQSDPTGYGLSATGTDNTAAFSLTGSSTGSFLTLTGSISGQPVTWLVLYDSTYNTFSIYDSDATKVGELSGANH